MAVCRPTGAKLNEPKLHPLSLRFSDPRYEPVYQQDHRERLRPQARVALVIGLALYIGLSVLDPWLVPEVCLRYLWGIRGAVATAALAVIALTYSERFTRWNQPALALVAMLASAGIALVAAAAPEHTSPFYFAGLLVLIIWTYQLAGLSFLCALGTGIAITVIYNTVFIAHQAPSLWLITAQNLFILCAHVVGGSATYLLERQRRLMVRQAFDLDVERRRHERLSLHDRLTRLPNRTYIKRRLKESLSQSLRDGSLNAGMFVDIDHFKPINDTYGHEAGDRVLQEIATVLQGCLRTEDTVGRIGGDEFFVIVRQLHKPEEAELVARKILRALAQPIALYPERPEPTCAISASIGICLFPRPGLGAEEVIRHADAAMYAAKRASGAHYAMWADEPSADAHSKAEIIRP